MAPAMEYAEQTDVGSKMLWILRNFKHGRATGAKEQVVEQALILKYKCG